MLNPKHIFFIWEGKSMSFLRAMTLISFRNHHKDWDITLITINCDLNKLPDHQELELSQATIVTELLREYKFDNLSLCRDANINIVDFDKEYNNLPGIKNVFANQKQDLLGWYLLSKNNCVVADMDILFIGSLDEEYNTFLKSNAEFGTVGGGVHKPKKRYLPVALMFSKESEFCEELFYKGIKNYDVNVFESCGNNVFPPSLYKQLHDPACERFFCISEELIFPLTTKMTIAEAMDTQYNTNYIFSSQDLPLIRILADYNILNLNKTAGIHWFGGNPRSLRFSKHITHENYKDDNTFISYFIKKNYIK
tara:strand:- start:689 stop:1615 length:927 start_codon:yes stop_codon:yes gene_type:complete